jgi:hypothetical protein
VNPSERTGADPESTNRSSLYLPLLIGSLASVITWLSLVLAWHQSPYFPSFFAASDVGIAVALLLFAAELFSPSRKSFELATTPEHPELRTWLYYWILVILLTFGFSSAGLILLLGVASAGPLVVGVGVPMTTIYFLFLLSRYSSRSFSRDVREPLRALALHTEQMDTQSAELNKLVGTLVSSTITLSKSVQQLVDLERESPSRKQEELKSNIAHLWFRGIGSPPANITIEVENRGEQGVINTVSLDTGFGLRRIQWSPRSIAPKDRFRVNVGSMEKKVKAVQVRIECEVQSVPPGKMLVQVASFNCTQLKSGWGTPQGVEITPADPQDGMKGAF